ncbi:hypothetical protein GCK32_010982 [Trichostrongylus colubriformis]|uniref:Potassium channel domain-containing protein n=2 Tax=Trichostrongylus colubriformis TaxID=6319 RepID=A0AAN8FND5_TRICO
MDQQLREIEGLLESSAHPEPEDATTRIKKYVKLALPHVALVAVVCLYAVIGAYIFYRLESPNEDRLKAVGKALIGDMRTNLIAKIRNGYGNIVPATSSGRIACVVFALFGAPLAIITIGDLGKFLSECTIWLYKEMKKGRALLYARWRRFRGLNKENEDAESQLSSSRSLDWEDLVLDKTEVPVFMVFTILLLYIAFGGVLFSFLEGWTYMDAFYYSFISLTNIGFGDIVPENHDYIVLMLAYLGIGLAVTTMCIDLVGIQYIQKIHYFGRKFRGTDLLHLLKRKRMIERRLAMGQGEEILQMYIQQMQNQFYIVLMLAYLGIGLAVTTMCIDLVGIQYIQKIHYFGRKFRGTDLLHLLKRKRMIERRLAMGQGEEILQMYIQQMQNQLPEPVVVEQQWEEDKTSSHIEWQIDDALMSSYYSFDFPLAIRVPSPNVLSIRSYRPPSTYSNSSASARSL